MQATSIVDMQTITHDNGFQDLLPALDGETYRLLEENILANGCRDPLVLWNGVLIDGYNRYKICTEHEIPFTTVSKEFGSREEVLIWIVSNQISRRNLSPVQLSFFRGVHYRADKQIVSNIRGRNQHSEDDGQKVHHPTTASRLAERYRVNPKTIRRDARFAAGIEAIGEASPEAKRKILSGEVAINRTRLQVLSYGQKEDIEAVAAEIEEGTYKRRAPDALSLSQDNGLSAEAEAPAGSGAFDTSQHENLVRMITADIDSFMICLQQGDTMQIKAALRAHIDALEALYQQRF